MHPHDNGSDILRRVGTSWNDKTDTNLSAPARELALMNLDKLQYDLAAKIDFLL